MATADPSTVLRLLVVMPSWVGDAVMATPTLRLIRRSLPGIFIGLLVKPGIDEVLAGLDLFDELHVARASGVMGPKFVAAKVRPRRYDTAILLTNSLSSALVARIAGIPRRLGYDRDARGLLLTGKLPAPKRPDGRWAVIPAVRYYRELASRLLLEPRGIADTDHAVPMELATTPEQDRAGDEVLARAGVAPGAALGILNPGGNNPAKRWPPERFAQIADQLAQQRRLTVLVNGSPGERDIIRRIAAAAHTPIVDLSAHGVSLGSLKSIIKRCRVMVTNDTGPRHIAAAFGVPLVSLFGPTDPRWTTIPTRPGAPEIILAADPTLPESEVADDHPDRCRIDRITSERVIAAVDHVLGARSVPS